MTNARELEMNELEMVNGGGNLVDDFQGVINFFLGLKELLKPSSSSNQNQPTPVATESFGGAKGRF